MCVRMSCRLEKVKVMLGRDCMLAMQRSIENGAEHQGEKLRGVLCWVGRGALLLRVGVPECQRGYSSASRFQSSH